MFSKKQVMMEPVRVKPSWIYWANLDENLAKSASSMWLLGLTLL